MPSKHKHQWLLSSLRPFDKWFAICEKCKAVCYGGVVHLPTEDKVSENMLKWGKEKAK